MIWCIYEVSTGEIIKEGTGPFSDAILWRHVNGESEGRAIWRGEGELTNHRIVDGERVALSHSEVDAARAKLQALIDLRKDEPGLIRVIEDIYEHLVNGVPIPQSAHDRVAKRKAQRAKLK